MEKNDRENLILELAINHMEDSRILETMSDDDLIELNKYYEGE